MYNELVKRLREIHPEEFGDKWDFAFACQQAMHEAADAIEELQKQRDEWESHAALAESFAQSWIPVTERLPEDRRDVLVYAGIMFPYITVGYYDGLWKFSYNDEEIAGSADYWMPLPSTEGLNEA